MTSYYECRLFNHCPFDYQCLKYLRKYGFIIWSVEVCYAVKKVVDEGYAVIVKGRAAPIIKDYEIAEVETDE